MHFEAWYSDAWHSEQHEYGTIQEVLVGLVLFRPPKIMLLTRKYSRNLQGEENAGTCGRMYYSSIGYRGP